MTQILDILNKHLLAVVSSTTILLLLATATINTMPERLPTLRDMPQWCWTWVRDASRLFLSLRNPSPPTQTTSVIETHSVSIKTPSEPQPQPALGPEGNHEF